LSDDNHGSQLAAICFPFAIAALEENPIRRSFASTQFRRQHSVRNVDRLRIVWKLPSLIQASARLAPEQKSTEDDEKDVRQPLDVMSSEIETSLTIFSID